MKILSFVFLTLILISCSSKTSDLKYFDYNTLSDLNIGDEELYVLNNFIFEKYEILNFKNDGVDYKIYYIENKILHTTVEINNHIDIFVLVYKDSKLVNSGILEDFRISESMLDRNIAKFISGLL